MPTPEELAADAAADAVEASPGLNVLVERMVDLKSQLDALEANRKEVQKDYDDLRKRLLPQVLGDQGWSNVKTPLGTLSLRTKTYASVPKEQRAEFWVWCHANGIMGLAVEAAGVLSLYNALVERGEPVPDCIRTYHEETAVLTRKKE
jgi:seryl-tRNA synthetase